MKIMAGKFKGHTIKTSQKLNYRPMKSIVRKSIFDILAPFHYDSVLDLFAGTGIFGFESASRGAKKVTFIESDIKSYNLLKRNTETFNEVNFIFFQMDVFKFLKKNKSFDLIFADPPYGKFNLNKLVDQSLKCLNINGKFLLECQKKDRPFMNATHKDYGNTRILCWEKYE